MADNAITQDAEVAKAAEATEATAAKVTEAAASEASSAEAKAEGADAAKQVEQKIDSEPQAGDFFAPLSAEDQAAAVNTYGPAIAGLMQTAGINFKAVDAAWRETGKIDQTVYDAFTKAGVNKSMVDGYLNGVKAAEAANQQEGAAAMAGVLDLAGGEDNYRKIVQWASTALTGDEIAEYNEALDGADTTVQAQRLAVSALRAKYEAANGKLPARKVSGRPAAASTPAEPQDIFANSAEIVAAMRDARYKNDDAYRMAIEAKVARSRVFGKGKAAAR
jgi:hypothetical protein